MTAPYPNFLVVGAQKAASTALLHTLRNHPDVWMPEQEDPFLRDPVFDPELLDDFLDRYAGHQERAVGLKCPDYLGRPEVPERIASLLNDPKIVIIVRNPVDRAISAYFWQVRWGALPIESPSVGLSRLLDGTYATDWPRSTEVLDWGLYHKHLTRYREFVPGERILVVQDRDFRDSRAETVGSVLRFLGLDEVGEDLVPPSSTNAGVYPTQRLRFLQIRNRYILKWNADRSYSTLFKPSHPLERAFSDSIAAFDRWVLARIYGNERPPIAGDVLDRLSDYYRDDSASFQEQLGRRLPGWP